MENPHSERQAVLLERIVKNAVSVISLHTNCNSQVLHHQDKCTELILELNHCVEVSHIHHGTRGSTFLIAIFFLQEIVRANAYIKTAADLETKYRKNVQYNLGAMSATDSEPHQTSDK
jgi:DASH complex subunit DAD4